MRIAYLDCPSGISGDMLLGALVDAGLSIDELRAELAKLPVEGYRLEAEKTRRAGLAATKVTVVLEEALPPGGRAGSSAQRRAGRRGRDDASSLAGHPLDHRRQRAAS